MALELSTCPNAKDGIGDAGCVKAPVLKFVNCFVPVLESQQFDSFDDFNDEEKNKEAIINREAFPLRIMEEMEDSSTESLTSETSTGTKLFHRNGRYGFIGSMLLTPDQNRILQSYNFKVDAGYIMDNTGNRLGTSPDGTVVKGLTVSYFHVMPMDLPFAADGSSWSKIEVQFEFVEEINKQPAYSIATDLDWIPKKVWTKPLTKLTITPGTVTANSFNTSFAYVDPTTGNSIALENLDTMYAATGGDALLTVLDENGDAVTATVTAVVGVPGDYTIAGTMASGSITLNAVYDATNTIESYYYSAPTAVASS